jgi:hypothetical protein
VEYLEYDEIEAVLAALIEAHPMAGVITFSWSPCLTRVRVCKRSSISRRYSTQGPRP